MAFWGGMDIWRQSNTIEIRYHNNFKVLKTWHILQKSPQVSFGDMVFWYHNKIRPLISGFHCSYQRFARHLNIGDSPIQIGNFCYDFIIFLVVFFRRFEFKFKKQQKIALWPDLSQVCGTLFLRSTSQEKKINTKL